jgi:exopolyphosphatase/guanosine-5'-triphosphate,3'-diphosphate pyrophosphatase
VVKPVFFLWGGSGLLTAVVDIGTNSVRLLLAEQEKDGWRAVDHRLVTTRLGEGLAKQAELRQSAIERTIAALAEFKLDINEQKATRVIAIATSAVRDAINGRFFVAEAKKRLGWEVRVLSGREEAEMSYLGAVHGLRGLVANPVVIDIGGGSTELIWPGYSGPEFTSVNVGAVRMTEGNYGPDEIRELLRSALAGIKLNESGGLVGVGGTITNLAAIDGLVVPYDSRKIHGYFLSREAVERILTRFEEMSAPEIRSVGGLQPGREDIIVAGTRILVSVLRGLGATGITVSETGIMSGLLYRATVTEGGRD